VTTLTATTLFSSNYQPYGVNYGQVGAEEFMYTGKMMDALTGLYYFGARFYDDAVGRFIAEDSSSGGLEDPMSLNRYIYARDNPMTITDQTGHDWWSSLTSAVSNTFAAVTAAASAVATTVTNAWNSLPPPTRDGLLIAGAVAVTVATAGAAAPAILATAAAIGATSSVAYAVAASAGGGTITGQGLLDSFRFWVRRCAFDCDGHENQQ
jgi:RHS repeat-associated protein